MSHEPWRTKEDALAEFPNTLALVTRQLTGEDAGRCGGFFCLSWTDDKGKTTILRHGKIGDVFDADRRRRYRKLSREKLTRRLKNPGHVSSWQSRNPEQDEWGGDIKAGDFDLSFSGLPELADEAVMLALAVILLLLTFEEACAIARISDNQYFLKIPVRAFLGRHPRAVEE